MFTLEAIEIVSYEVGSLLIFFVLLSTKNVKGNIWAELENGRIRHAQVRVIFHQ